MQGVETIKGDGYTLHQVFDFSDEMKSVLRKELVGICRGVSALCSHKKTDSYKAVVGELVARILKKDENGCKGVIGELLVHLMVKVEMPDKRAASALFNLEDRSFKKGFDLTLCDSESNTLWFTEVKSGEVSPGSSLTATMNGLLARAKGDLINRLDKDDAYSLWTNAIQHAERALSNNSDKKQAIVEILDDLYDRSSSGSYDHTEASAILAAIVFDKRTNELAEEDVRRSYERHKRNDGFDELIILVIQKATYSAVVDFLRQEAQ